MLAICETPPADPEKFSGYTPARVLAEAEMLIDVEVVAKDGAKVAVRPCGKFTKLRFTDELNPPSAVIVKGMPLRLCPGVTVWSGTAPNTKSGPKLAVTLLGAVMLTFCGVAYQ